MVVGGPLVGHVGDGEEAQGDEKASICFSKGRNCGLWRGKGCFLNFRWAI